MTMRLARDRIPAGPSEVAHSKATAYGHTLSPLSLQVEGGEMPVNYVEVLKDLEEREAHLLAELAKVRQAKPAIQSFAKQEESAASSTSEKPRYIGMGATAAVRDVYANTQEFMSRDEIYTRLKLGGWTTEAKDPLAALSATLSQMVSGGELEKVEDRWRRKVQPRPIFPLRTDWASRPEFDLSRVEPLAIEPRQPSEQ